MKKLLAFFLAFSMIFALAGCDAPAEPYPESGSGSHSELEPSSSGPESRSGPVSVASEATAKDVTLTGVVAEFVPGLFFLTLEDGSQTAFQADAIEGYEVRVGDTVTIRYTDDGKSLKVNSVEVDPAAGTEAPSSSQAAPVASSQAPSSQEAPSQAAPSQAASSQAGPSWTTGQRASYSVTAVVVKLTPNMLTIDQNGTVITLDRKLFEGRLGHTFRIGDVLTIGYFESGNMGWPVSMAVTGFDPTVDPDDYDNDDDWDEDGDNDDDDDYTPPGNSTSNDIDFEKWAYEVVDLANKERVKAGRTEVPIDNRLMELAALRAGELDELWGHTRPNGESDSYLGAPDYRWVMCNLGKGYGSPAAVVEGWMNSTGHRNNILYAGHDWVGAGCCQGTDGRYYWVIVYYREGGYYPDYPTPES